MPDPPPGEDPAGELRPQEPVVLGVDQELGERARPRVRVELADPAGAVVVGKREDVEQLGAGSGTERVQTLTKLALKVLQVHGAPSSRLPTPRT